MPRPPPVSTLFPYTTLFRSRARLLGDARWLLSWELVAVRTATSSQDRKSTRLNSSHRTISYAVFCLKKKTTGQGVNLQVSKQGPTPSQNYTTLHVQFPATDMKFVFNVTTVFAGLLSYSPGSNSFTFEANPFPLVDGTYNVTRAKVTLQTGDWQSPRIPLPLN